MAKKGFGGLILGATISVVAALFWTPKRGYQWRDKIADKSGKFKGKAADTGASAKIKACSESAILPGSVAVNLVEGRTSAS